MLNLKVVLQSTIPNITHTLKKIITLKLIQLDEENTVRTLKDKYLLH